MSTCLNSYDLLFHAAQGEDESYLDKSSCASGGPTLDNPFSSPSAIVAGKNHAGLPPFPPGGPNMLPPLPLWRPGGWLSRRWLLLPAARRARPQAGPLFMRGGE